MLRVGENASGLVPGSDRAYAVCFASDARDPMRQIAVLGLGYVGLVVSIELGVLVVAVLEVGFVTAAVRSGLGLGDV